MLASVFLCGLSGALFPHFPVQFDNPVFDLLLPLLSEGYVSHGLGTLLGLAGWAGLGPWLLAVAVAVAATLAGTRPRWTAAAGAAGRGAAAGRAVAAGGRAQPARGGAHPGHRARHVGTAAAGWTVMPRVGRAMGLLERLASTLAGGADLDDGLRAEIEEALARGGADGGNWAAAEAALLELATRRPEAPEVQVALGEVRVRRGKDEAAVEAFGRAVDLSPQMVDGWLGLGEALARLGRHEPAREALRKVLARTFDPVRRARAHAGRGRIALALDEPARAVRELRQAVELQPADMTMAHQLGRALVAAGEPEVTDGFRWLVHAARSPAADPGWVLEAAAAAPTPAAAEAILRDRLEAAAPVPLLAHQRAALEAALATPAVPAGPRRRGAAAGRGRRGGGAARSGRARRRWRCATRRAGRHREALAALLRGAARPSVDAARLVRLALGAQDREALGEVAARLRAARPEAPAAGAAAGFCRRVGRLARRGCGRRTW